MGDPVRLLGVFAVLAASGCQMSADYGGTDYLCAEGRCPDGLMCVDGHCRSSALLVDARAGDDAAGRVASIVIEAEQFSANVMQGQVPWHADSTDGHSGEGAMLADGPGISAITYPAYYTSSSRLDYELTLEASGIYYLWVRGMAWSGSDTCIPGLDGTGWAGNANPGGSLWVPVVQPTGWTWGGADGLSSERVTVAASEPGRHTLSIWLREDGIILDKILLTTDVAYTPSGLGPLATE